METDIDQDTLKTHYTKLDEESERFFEKQMEDAKKSSAADRDFFGASQFARRSVKENSLLPIRNRDGELEYTLQQGLKAACHTREEVIAITVIQHKLLQRLDRNHRILWVAIALLAYIAYQLS